ncbi:MAG: hypothetical protein ACK40X_03700 [Armatimonadota bacterium]
MPAIREHVAKAQSIERVLTVLDDQNPDHWDWIAIVAFYAALHWVDAFLAAQGSHPQNHRERNRLVNLLVPANLAYGILYSASRRARYEAEHISRQKALQCRDQLLPQIRQWVQRQIGYVP